MPLDGWNFACPDWVDRLREGRSLVPDLPLDQEAAARAVKIFDMLRLPDVPGQPAMAEAAGEWFRDIVRALFGSVDRETGQRMVGELFLLVPKKNSKTTNSAGIGLTAMLLNERPNAEMMIAGPTQDVADTCFEQIKGMIDADPEGYLARRFHVVEHKKTIRCRITKTVLKVRTFDMKVMTGKKPILVILDELHIMSMISNAERVLTQIRGGFEPFPESLFVIITTQSDTPPSGVFKQELAYARDVRDGRVTEGVRMLPVLYEFPEEMQSGEGKAWAAPENWPMVLPNLGRSVSLDSLKREFNKAQAKGRESMALWASQFLNVEIGLALHTNRWRGADYWQQAGEARLTFDEILATSEVCVFGVDGGGLDDLLGLAMIGRHRETKRWQHWARAWVHPDVLENRKEIASQLEDFARAGELVFCEAPTQDVIEIGEWVQMVAEAGLLPEEHAIGLDPYGISAIVDELSGREITDKQMVAIGQGVRLSPATWGLERKLKDGTFRHGAQSLMAWCVGNARLEQRGNAVLITKEVSGRAKIDPLVATLNAHMLMARNPVAAVPEVSPWEDENFRMYAA